MSTNFTKIVTGIPEIAARITKLRNRLENDLELSADYNDVVYDEEQDLVTAQFDGSIDKDKTKIVNNLIKIIVENQEVGTREFRNEHNKNKRETFGATSSPTTATDCLSGYSKGSIITTTDDRVYICLNNTKDAASWVQLYPQENGSENSQGNFFSMGCIYKELSYVRNKNTKWKNISFFSFDGSTQTLNMVEAMVSLHYETSNYYDSDSSDDDDNGSAADSAELMLFDEATNKTIATITWNSGTRSDPVLASTTTFANVPTSRATIGIYFRRKSGTKSQYVYVHSLRIR